MKKALILMLSIIISLSLSACDKTADDISQNGPSEPSDRHLVETIPDLENVTDSASADEIERNENEIEENRMTNISIIVSSSVFTAKLYDNDVAKALLALLPMNLDMSELHGNEKYYYLSDRFPTDSQQIGSISAGDLMLYGSDCLVLFYESFSTSYSYTRLGYIEDASGLTAALGSGNVEIMFAVSE